MLAHLKRTADRPKQRKLERSLVKVETAPDKPTFVLVHCAQVFAKQNTELSIISGQRIIFES